ncbi:MAG: peptidoglycan DD-metalloendopeptidase family protein [Candidatus Accumulibacter sp.]|nr:peptidoglycan DD-metalloendopeptidase family protein [Accumulibacter sp.]
MLSRHGLSLSVSILFVLAACASHAPAPVGERAGGTGRPAAAAPAVAGKDIYVVKKGDTLHSIALDHGLDYRELAAWNNIENPNRILVGQALRVRASGVTAAVEGVVVRPITTGSPVEQRPLGSPGSSVEQRASVTGSELLKRAPLAGKEAYSEQALARAQSLAVEPVAVAPVAVKPEVKPEAKPEARIEAKPEVKPEAKPEAKPDETRVSDAAGGEEVSWLWPASGKLIGTFSEGGNKGIDISGKAGDSVLAAAGGKVVYSGTGLRGYGKLVIVKHNNTYLTAYAHNQNVLVKEGQAVTRGQKIAEMGNTDADQVKLHFEIRRQGKPVDPLKHLPAR